LADKPWLDSARVSGVGFGVLAETVFPVISIPRKVGDGVTPSPTRETCALPGS
jgi:hypothetical protein